MRPWPGVQSSVQASIYTWSKVSGPGTLAFGSSNAEDTTISANLDGSYIVRLTVFDAAGNSASDDLTFIWDTTAPTFDGISLMLVLTSQIKAQLFWSAATDVNTLSADIIYEICQSSTVNDCVTNFHVTYTTAPGRLDYGVSGLGVATYYEFVVRAKDSLGNRDINTIVKHKNTLGSVAAIATSNANACAVLSDGTVACWGSNTYGQLGDGTNITKSTPVLVSGISTAISVVLGGYHVCALLVGGTIKCWGRNDIGS